MRIFKYLVFFSSILLLIACNKELERPDRNFQGLRIKPPTSITETGINIEMNIIGDISNITEYGFVWNASAQQQPRLFGLRKSFSGAPASNIVSATLNYDLPIGDIRIAPFIRTTEKLIYGPTTLVESKGGIPPTITSITPSNFVIGDTLYIQGEGFASSIRANTVTIDGNTAFIHESSRTLIKVRGPRVNDPNPTVIVTSWDKSTEATFSIANGNPFITSLSKAQGGIDEQVTLYGGNFSSNNNEIIFRNQQNGNLAEVVAVFRDSIILRVPNLISSIDNLVYSIEVTSDGVSSIKENCFTFRNPKIDANQDAINLCDTITITGNNFSPILENNTFIKNDFNQSIRFLKGNTKELKFLLQENHRHGVSLNNDRFFRINLNLNGLNQEFLIPITPSIINTMSPSTSANGDIIVEVNGDGFSSFSSDYVIFDSYEDQSVRINSTAIEATCEKLTFKIDNINFGQGILFNDIWTITIDHPGGRNTIPIQLNIEGKLEPLNRTSFLFERDEVKRAFSYQNKGYVATVNGLFEYDQANDVFIKIAPILEGMDDPNLNNQVVNNLAIHTWLYQNELKTAAFDFNTNSWIEFPPPSDGVEPANFIYIDFASMDKYFLIDRFSNQFWEYAPLTNLWNRKSNLPIDIELNETDQAFSILDKVYIYSAGKIFIYDPVLELWTQGSSNTSNLNQDQYTSMVLNDKLYTLTTNDSSNKISEYDPNLDSWTVVAEYTNRANSDWKLLFAANDKLYFYSDNISNEFPYSITNFWSFNPN